MPHTTNPDFLFALFETQRLLRLYADKQAQRHGLTKAQWAVLAKLERTEGLKQTEVADLMDMAPITLTRLIDKLCDSGLIERRGDPADRRINRLYLTDAAKPLMATLATLRGEITRTALSGLGDGAIHELVGQLETVKDNIRDALQGATAGKTTNRIKDARYG
ncbi:MAG: transcriptional regulator, MarR family [Tardiphaga sp.]|nr:transcriptional regulator, MarR family [Tardiphaga sp.]MDB5547311.1 transcriptional regulator, MarR family [Tardiphaga sp.]MDB5573271.1 transcriptional regulator, MarR family [Tardiphaga sp.]MDB5625953.1 transcriptional regulator, MarR family [Tardiphaga sp.]MDB5629809.1 transcriptional regulator, MarR family [Tardiphaga sp.]